MLLGLFSAVPRPPPQGPSHRSPHIRWCGDSPGQPGPTHQTHPLRISKQSTWESAFLQEPFGSTVLEKESEKDWGLLLSVKISRRSLYVGERKTYFHSTLSGLKQAGFDSPWWNQRSPFWEAQPHVVKNIPIVWGKRTPLPPGTSIAEGAAQRGRELGGAEAPPTWSSLTQENVSSPDTLALPAPSG